MNEMEKTQLLGMTPDELAAYLKALGQPAFRAKQVFSWLHQGAAFEQMSNLPKALRETLAETCTANPVAVLETIESKLDGTIKLLYRLPDGHVIEGVLMRYKYGNTLCLSTQVGCRMGCAFCASTLDGCARSLTPAEMLGQIVCANGVLAPQGQKVGNIVLMGSGEPLDNYDNVVKFLRILRMEGGLCIGMRSVSLSTCGLVENMRRFAEEGRKFDLVVLDPPKFIESQRALTRGCRAYQDIARLGFGLLAPGGLLFNFSCSGLMTPELFQKITADAAVEAGVHGRLVGHLEQAPDHPTALAVPEGFYLKGLVTRI